MQSDGEGLSVSWGTRAGRTCCVPLDTQRILSGAKDRPARTQPAGRITGPARTDRRPYDNDPRAPVGSPVRSAGRLMPCRRMIFSRLAWSASPSSAAVRVTCHSFRSSAVISIRRSASALSA